MRNIIIATFLYAPVIIVFLGGIIMRS